MTKPLLLVALSGLLSSLAVQAAEPVKPAARKKSSAAAEMGAWRQLWASTFVGGASIASVPTTTLGSSATTSTLSNDTVTRDATPSEPVALTKPAESDTTTVSSNSVVPRATSRTGRPPVVIVTNNVHNTPVSPK
jgi:hypothetical protein